MRAFRVILPVANLERATSFYATLRAVDGERVTSGRHYVDCEDVLLGCWDPFADGDPAFPDPTEDTST